jgi:hypothetical protein
MSIDATNKVPTKDPFLHRPAPLSGPPQLPRLSLRAPTARAPDPDILTSRRRRPQPTPTPQPSPSLSRDPSSSRQSIIIEAATARPLLLPTEASGIGKRPRRQGGAGGRAARGGQGGHRAGGRQGGTWWPGRAAEACNGLAGGGQVRGREWVLLPMLYFCRSHR